MKNKTIFANIIILSFIFLSGCSNYKGNIDPNGDYHSIKRICYKNDGCIVQDCVTHYEANDKETIK